MAMYIHTYMHICMLSCFILLFECFVVLQREENRLKKLKLLEEEEQRKLAEKKQRKYVFLSFVVDMYVYVRMYVYNTYMHIFGM